MPIRGENAGSIPVARSLRTPQADPGFCIAAFQRSLARNDRRAPYVPQRAPNGSPFSATQPEDGRQTCNDPGSTCSQA